jgi:hypothetical protein
MDGIEGMPTVGRDTDGSRAADAAFLSRRDEGLDEPLPPFDSGVAILPVGAPRRDGRGGDCP